MAYVVTILLLLWFHETGITASDAKAPGKLCKAIRLQAPYIETQGLRVGGVYIQRNVTVAKRPTFVRLLSKEKKYYDLVHFNETVNRWEVSLVHGEYLGFYIYSNASHPVLAKGIWQVKTEKHSPFTPFENVSFECVRDHIKIEVSCRSIRLQAPYLTSQSAIVGKVFRRTNLTVHGRFIYQSNINRISNTTEYVYYSDAWSTWNVADTYEANDTFKHMISNSAADHPVKVKAAWYYAYGNEFLLSSIFFECVAEAPISTTNCSTIRVRRPYIPEQTSTFGTSFRQTNTSINSFPAFTFHGTDTTFYVCYSVVMSLWIISNNCYNKTVMFLTNSNAKHPVDIQSTWYYVANNMTVLPVTLLKFECISDETRISSTCTKVKFEGPIPNSAWRSARDMGFDQSPYRSSDRPIFWSREQPDLTTLYLYFVNSSWKVGRIALSSSSLFKAFSNAKHPADIKSFWIQGKGEEGWFIIKNGSFVCDFDRIGTTTCKAIRMIKLAGGHLDLPGLFNDLDGIINKVFEETSSPHEQFPTFELRAQESWYIKHVFGKESSGSVQSSWGIYKGNSNVPYAWNLGVNRHPAELSTPWYRFSMNISFSLLLDNPLTNLALVCDGNIFATQTAEEVQNNLVTIGTSVGVLAAVGGIVIFGIVLTVIIKKKPQCLINLRVRMPFQTQDQLPYDAFICYKSDGPGQTFTRNILFPKLKNEWCVSVAFDKDFTPGTPIDANIKRFFESSRVLLLVITEDFLVSGWCRREVKAAFDQMVSTGTKIIPILLEDVRDSDNLDYGIKQILQTVTYLVVPENQTGREMERFWKLLRRAIPTPRPDVSLIDTSDPDEMTDEANLLENSDSGSLDNLDANSRVGFSQSDFVERMRLELLEM